MAQSIFAGLTNTGGISRVVGGIHGTWGNPSGPEQTVSEAGVGAVIPWAGRLWFNTYPAENGEGYRLGTWSMGDDLVPVLEAEDRITSAGRIIHNNRLFISRTVVNRLGEKATITSTDPGWTAMRIAGYAVLPGDTTYVWALSMAGEIWRVTAAAPHVASLVAGNTGLGIGGQPHGKAIWGHPTGRYLFAVLNGDSAGRLARFDTTANTWAVLSSGDWPWIEVAGSYDGTSPSGLFYATGHDRKSALLWMFDPATPTAAPRKFRIPLSSRQQLDGWQHEWMRIRQVETERFLMDLHGGFYQLSISTSDRTFATGMPLVEPVCRHARTVTDFVSWHGYLVLGSNQNTPQVGNKYPTAGQPDSGLLLTTTDDLWSWGKPAGDGQWWDNENVTAGVESEPMLMRGYDRKMLWVQNASASALNVAVKVQHLNRKATFTTLAVAAGAYVHHEFPDGYGADWVTVTPDASLSGISAGVVYS